MPPTILLVPVKAWTRAKSRLQVPGVPVPDLAAAFAADALQAALGAHGVSEVVVVTDAPDLAVDGARVLPDRGAGDLNVALLRAAAELRVPPGAALAAMCADLPCLLAADLDAALERASGRRAYVADADGTGTTLLLAGPDEPLDPRFGLGSAARHEDSAAAAIDLAVPTLRRDVDTEDDLAAAIALGVGRHTHAVLAAAGAL